MKLALLTLALTGTVAWGMAALAPHKRPESAPPPVARTGVAGCRDVALDQGGAAVLRWCGPVGLERTSGRWRPAGPVRPLAPGAGVPIN